MKEMSPITPEERKWIKKLQKVLNECPSTRLAAYTSGNHDVSFYDTSFENEIAELQDNHNRDFGPAVEQLDCKVGEVVFPFCVHSTAA